MTKLHAPAGALAGLALALAFAGAPAWAQTAGVDHIDRVPGGGGPGPGSNEAVRLVKPGALLFASFDRNFDGVVTTGEIDLGTSGSFAVADKNKDGAITGFEQSDWAAAIGASAEVFSNPMQFDLDLDRSVTPVEFAAGLKRIADALVNPSTGAITFVDLVKPMKAASAEQAELGLGQGAPLESRPVTR
jgi:hypothetical protein